MQKIVFAVALVALTGCGKSKPTEDWGIGKPAAKAEEKNEGPKPPEKLPSKSPATKKTEPAPPPKSSPGKLPELKLSLADAKVRILNLDRAEVKALLGPPDDTSRGMFNGVNTVKWIYFKQRVIWNEDTDKYYALVVVTFYDTIDGTDTGKPIDLQVP